MSVVVKRAALSAQDVMIFHAHRMRLPQRVRSRSSVWQIAVLRGDAHVDGDQFPLAIGQDEFQIELHAGLLSGGRPR